MTVRTDDGTTKFNIGDENTSTNQYYIAKDDEDSTVYVVSSSTVTPFMNSLYDYAQGEDFPTIDFFYSEESTGQPGRRFLYP